MILRQSQKQLALTQLSHTNIQITKVKNNIHQKKNPSNLSHTNPEIDPLLGYKTPKQAIPTQDVNTQQITQTNNPHSKLKQLI